VHGAAAHVGFVHQGGERATGHLANEERDLGVAVRRVRERIAACHSGQAVDAEIGKLPSLVRDRLVELDREARDVVRDFDLGYDAPGNAARRSAREVDLEL
jgi:hypothetical protein